jgi:hypothetical protein
MRLSANADKGRIPNSVYYFQPYFRSHFLLGLQLLHMKAARVTCVILKLQP